MVTKSLFYYDGNRKWNEGKQKQLTAQLNQHSVKFNTRQKDTESPR